MIFVTVGTHEQQFDRLVKAVDELKIKGTITEDVIIQTGYSDYIPQMCEYNQFYPYQDICRFTEEARIVITHGGPSSFLMPLQLGKVPIVVPRKKDLGEHVNDHQVEFCHFVAEQQGNILVIDDIDTLEEVIRDYDSLTKDMAVGLQSHNAEFCAELEEIVEDLFR